MDGDRFDDLSRKLAAGMSRRQALKGFAAGLLGALGLRGAADAQVSQVYCGNQFCNGNPGVCKPGCVCCIYTNPITGKVINSRCQPPNLCTGQATCGPGKVLHPVQGCIPPCLNASSCPQPPVGSCQIATCSPGGLCGVATAQNNAACGTGQICCGGACTPLGTLSNCATCGNACSENQICSSGACVCPNDTCNGACCPTGTVCIGGTCTSRGGLNGPCDPGQDGDCQPGLTCCGAGTGVCTQLGTTTNCASCGDRCDDNNPCTTDACASGLLCEHTPVSPGTLCSTSTGATGSCNASGVCVAFVCAPGSTQACYDGPAGTVNIGTCHEGTKTCNATGSAYGACVGQVVPTQETVCDDRDSDCDGVLYEACACVPGSSQACYTGPAGTQDVGICRAGTQTCNSAGSGYGACVGEVLPTQEVCNNLDDDCDGAVDDGIVGIGAACSTGKLGVCATGTTQCQSGAIVCNQNIQPQTEICDGLDNDCNGVVDNGATCTGGRQCVSGQCACPANQHVCADVCVSNSSTQTCGASCSPCPARTNATATCNGTACGFTCNSGFGNCDGNAANGCETNLNTTDNHCGACGSACSASEACVSGSCVTVCTSETCGQTGCGTGVTCRSPEGSRPAGTCEADGQCCVASGRPSGGVPGQWCSAVNCCGSCFVNTGLCS